MRVMRLILGSLLILLGLHLIGQGTGYFPRPRNPVMDNKTESAWYGSGAIAAGLVAIRFFRPRR
jgi:hypothetical protein